MAHADCDAEKGDHDDANDIISVADGANCPQEASVSGMAGHGMVWFVGGVNIAIIQFCNGQGVGIDHGNDTVGDVYDDTADVCVSGCWNQDDGLARAGSTAS